MTLCKYRPRRAYDACYVMERNDVNGLLKKLEEEARYAGRNGLASTPYYMGALLAFKTLFSFTEFAGETDRWTDFMPMFEQALQQLEGD